MAVYYGLFSKKKKAEMTDKILVGNAEFVLDSKIGDYIGELIVWERKTKIRLEIKCKEGNICLLYTSRCV